MGKLKSKTWWMAAGTRAIKTVAETAIAMIGTSALVEQVKWQAVVSAAIMAGVVSILLSLKGLPEVPEAEAKTE